ncbi:MAG: solute carrier family 23 protein [Bacilli bacterium]|nr:solute carrier family 23 protein [Bacilli bacterium]
MIETKANKKLFGYLPDENPSFFKLLLFAVQHIIVMFPATVLVALITGFHVSTTIFASGLATLCFIFITKGKIPLYYGSSFSYITAISSITMPEVFGNPAPDHLISAAQFGIILSGLISIAVGLIVRKVSMEKIEKILPPTVTGSVALIIGLSLAGGALTNITNVSNIVGVSDDNAQFAQNLSWVIGLVTLLATIFFSVYLKRGVWSQIPILLGLLLGYAVALIIRASTGIHFVDFSLGAGGTFFTTPHFTLPKADWAAALAIMPIAIATIPESTAHLYQLDLYVNKLAEEKKAPKRYKIAEKLGINLIGDGLGDIVSGMIGGPAGTNYGENISTMALTKNYSVRVLVAASILTMVLSFVTPLSAAVYSIPSAVIGGLSVYLFGVIGAQGISIMMDKKVSLFDSKNLSIIASILIIGLGGSALPDGIPFFGINLPPIATAAIFGILLNLVYVLVAALKKKFCKAKIEAEVLEDE